MSNTTLTTEDVTFPPAAHSLTQLAPPGGREMLVAAGVYKVMVNMCRFMKQIYFRFSGASLFRVVVVSTAL